MWNWLAIIARRLHNWTANPVWLFGLTANGRLERVWRGGLAIAIRENRLLLARWLWCAIGGWRRSLEPSWFGRSNGWPEESSCWPNDDGPNWQTDFYANKDNGHRVMLEFLKTSIWFGTNLNFGRSAYHPDHLKWSDRIASSTNPKIDYKTRRWSNRRLNWKR